MSIADHTVTMRRLIDDAAGALRDAGIGSPRVDAELLAAHVLGIDRGRAAFADVDRAAAGRYRELVARRAARVPLQHLTGSAAFGPVTVAVGPGVFIPRPETESLFEWVVEQDFSPSHQPELIVDLCTGSGALALALARHFPGSRVIAVDNSDDALLWARRNTDGTGVEVLRGDATDAALLPDLDGAVDLLVSNPPYIPDGARLEPEVAHHDPAHALFGGPDGMAVIDRLVHIAARLLRAGGVVAIEHDDTTSVRTVRAVEATGAFTCVTPRHDLAGRPRFVTAVRAG